MTHSDQIAAVARLINPLLGVVHDEITRQLAGETAHMCILIVAVANEAQFVSSRDHETTRQLMRELAPRFAAQPGDPATDDQAEASPDDPINAGAAVFDELLTQFEATVREPARHSPESYANARANVVEQFRAVLHHAIARKQSPS